MGHHTQNLPCHYPSRCLIFSGVCGWLRGVGAHFAYFAFTVFVSPCITEQAPSSSPLFWCVLPFACYVNGRHLCGLACADSNNGMGLVVPQHLFALLPFSKHACTAACPAPAAFNHHRARSPKGTTPSICHDCGADGHMQATPSLSCVLAVDVKGCFLLFPFPHTNQSFPHTNYP